MGKEKWESVITFKNYASVTTFVYHDLTPIAVFLILSQECKTEVLFSLFSNESWII